jgi:hypothetical protein
MRATRPKEVAECSRLYGSLVYHLSIIACASDKCLPLAGIGAAGICGREIWLSSGVC